jgi:anti-sigma regulatory factor (Ser/Thr protein kinase)
VTTAVLPTGASSFVHHAFFYADVDEYVSVTQAFIADGLAAHEAVLVAVPADRLELVRAAAPVDVPSVQLIDMAEFGRNPGRIIPLWQDFVARSAGRGLGVRGIGEPVWAGRSAAELVECHRHEELLNLAFADGPAFPLMCPYDVAGLDPAVIEAARRSHPFTYRQGGLDCSEPFTGVPDPSDDLELALDEPPASADLSTFGAGGLAAVRRLVYERATAVGLTPHQAADLVLSVNEVATNSLRHGGGRGTVWLWSDVRSFVCEVRDAGRIGQALVGRQRGALNASGGRGLWLVHQLCDLVELRSGRNGTTVRMSIYLPA